MSVRSPSAASAAATGSTPLLTGRLSPVSAASATSSVAAASTRPSAGTTSPASIATTSPGHELLGRKLRQRAVASHPGLDDHHLLKRRHRRRRLALLAEPEHRVEQGQQQDHDPRARLLDRVDRDHPRDQQHDLHRVLVLAQERLPARLGLRLGEAVRAVALQALGRLLARQAALRLDAQLTQRALAREHVPDLCLARGSRRGLGDGHPSVLSGSDRGHRGAATAITIRHVGSGVTTAAGNVVVDADEHQQRVNRHGTPPLKPDRRVPAR